MRGVSWSHIALALAVLWAVVLHQSAAPRHIELTFEAPLPYGCPSAEQLQRDMNRSLAQASHPHTALQQFFSQIGQYHHVEIRCPSNSLCRIEAEQSPALGLWQSQELLLSHPLRLSPNPYAYQPNWVIESTQPPSQSLEALCESLKDQHYFESSGELSGRLIVRADGTTTVEPQGPYPELWFWPLEGAPQKWQQLRDKINKPWKTLESCDLRYTSGATYQSKKKQTR